LNIDYREVLDIPGVVGVVTGKDAAEAIPGARLMLIEGMGHDLPHGGAWRRIVEAIAARTLRETI